MGSPLSEEQFESRRDETELDKLVWGVNEELVSPFSVPSSPVSPSCSEFARSFPLAWDNFSDVSLKSASEITSSLSHLQLSQINWRRMPTSTGSSHLWLEQDNICPDVYPKLSNLPLLDQ